LLEMTFLEKPAMFQITPQARERMQTVMDTLRVDEHELLAFMWLKHRRHVRSRLEDERYDTRHGGIFTSIWDDVNLCLIDRITDGQRRTSVMTMIEADFAMTEFASRQLRQGHMVYVSPATKAEDDDDLSL
jgi:hypothetical protein